jgi:oligopeptide/dipeptide ABC transporter ATP-binding protein
MSTPMTQTTTTTTTGTTGTTGSITTPGAPGIPAYATPAGQVDPGTAPVRPGAPLLEVRNLRTYFPIRKGLLARTVGHVKAVDDVSFDIAPGRTLGLVGESGCGKTTVGRTILRLIPAHRRQVRYKGEDFFAYRGEALRRLRRQMQIVFQDPVSSLNPRMTVGNIIGEPIEVHGIAKGQEKARLVASLLKRVGLDPSYAARYPHEFSGGQRQRIGIARRPFAQPRLHRLRRAVSALDVSIQSQILNLLDDLQRERTSRSCSSRTTCGGEALLRRGRGDVPRPDRRAAGGASCTPTPSTPYTVSLLSHVPEPDPRPRKKRVVLEGEVPSPSNPPSGCPFHPRCPLTRQVAAESSDAETVQITVGGQPRRVMRRCVESGRNWRRSKASRATSRRAGWRSSAARAQRPMRPGPEPAPSRFPDRQLAGVRSTPGSRRRPACCARPLNASPRSPRSHRSTPASRSHPFVRKQCPHGGHRDAWRHGRPLRPHPPRLAPRANVAYRGTLAST